MAGYHLKEIPKGTIGYPSKIKEEFLEFEDALNQNNPIMALVELSDLLGAIEIYTTNLYNITLTDLMAMKEATNRAFQSGERSD